MLTIKSMNLSLAEVQEVVCALPWAVLLCDADARVLFANQPARATLATETTTATPTPGAAASDHWLRRRIALGETGASLELRIAARPVDGPTLALALSEAAAACLEQTGPQQALHCVQQALAPFGLAAWLALPPAASTAGWQLLPQPAPALQQLFDAHPDAAPQLVAARIMHEALVTPGWLDLAPDLRRSEDDLLHSIGALQWVVLPLHSTGRILGVLLCWGPGLRRELLTALAPFGALLGTAFGRLLLTEGMQGDAAALLRATQALTLPTDLDAMLRAVCEQATLLSGATTTALLVPQADDGALRCVMASGDGAELVLGRRRRLVDHIIGRLTRTQARLVIDDARQAVLLPPALRAHTPLRSIALQTLYAQERLVGVLAVGHAAPRAFQPAQLQRLEQFAATAAVALENAQLQESLRRSEERYRTLFQNALEIVIALDLEGRIITCNRAALQFLRLSPAEVRGRALHIDEVLPAPAVAWVRSMQQRALLGGATQPAEIPLRAPHGSEAVIEMTLQLLQERGQPAGVYLIGRDITERHRQQERLSQQVAQLTALHKLSLALSDSLASQGLLQRAVEAIAAAAQFAVVAIYLPQRATLELSAASGLSSAAAQHAGLLALVRQVWQTGHAWLGTTLEVPAWDGVAWALEAGAALALVPLQARANYGVLLVGRAGQQAFSTAEVRVVQTMAAQIAQALENMRLFRAAEQSAARYRDLFENANDFIGTLTADGRILALNRAALEFFGYTAADLSRLTLAHLLPPQHAARVDEVLELLQHQAVQAAQEVEMLRADRAIATIEIRTRLLREGDAVVAIHFIARDITERRQLEAQVRQGEKLAALGQLVAGAAHELNNPLAVVLGAAQLLLHDPEATRFRDDLRTIEAAAQRARHIVRQMLTFARQHKEQPGSVDLALVVQRVVDGARLMLQRARVDLQVSIAPDLPPVRGDSYQLEQVLDNLLHNAVQALAQTPSTPQVRISVAPHGERVRLVVSDNGPGIAPEHRSRIFDPFFTTKEVGQGTGLGLSLVYAIVDQHGGTVQVESQPGQGATFIVELPTGAPQPQQPAIILTRGATRSAVLVVEDEPDVCQILQRALGQQGYLVETVQRAEVALRRLASEHYDLVITDLRMPGLSGQAFFEQARALYPQLKWIFITGDTMSSQSERFLQSSGMPYLSKPFSLDELWEAVATALLGRPG